MSSAGTRSDLAGVGAGAGAWPLLVQGGGGLIRLRGVAMAKPVSGTINVDVTQSVPDWGPYTQPIAPEGTPSVLYIVLDDVGYSATGPYGGVIEKPNNHRGAGRG